NNTDIFRVKLPIVQAPETYVSVRGKDVDKDAGRPTDAKVLVERLPDGKGAGVAQTNTDTGEYELRLPTGHLYGLRAASEGQISESQNIDLRNVNAGETVASQDFNLAPIEVTKLEENATITLNNIFFDFDKSLLKPESVPELDHLVELLKKNESMQIEISGHTDNLSADQYNLALSERRAKTVVAYLIRSGIDESRLTVQFFGESKPVDSNDTEEGRQRNRRVEFKILKL